MGDDLIMSDDEQIAAEVVDADEQSADLPCKVSSDADVRKETGRSHVFLVQMFSAYSGID